ncbi:MAG: putative lipid II flippase FtsW [Actinomycetota bacterium]
MLVAAATLTLVVLGLVMILSASSVSAFAEYGSSFVFFKKQVVWAVVGLGCLLFFANLDYQKLRGVGYLALAGTLLMLVAVLVPAVGVTVGGSSRWLALGPLSFQPSELAKLALVLFGAEVFSRKDERTLEDLAHTALPMVPVLGLVAALVIAQPDLGTTLLLSTIGFGLMAVAGAPGRYLVPLGLAAATLASIAAFGEQYRRARLLAFLDPWADPLRTGYHTIQSLIALGSGGWFGVGLGASRQKWMYVPNAHTDFIFAILGEETGLLGTLVVLGLFGFIAYLGIRIARHAPDRFGMLVASGITVWIAVQALVNMGAATASLPITGVPLPFVSFGGSSLVISLAAAGILINIGRQGETRPAPRRPARARTPAPG